MTTAWRKSWMGLLAIACALLAQPAFALGLGQLQVKSQAGQPLLAEIPIVSSDPSELENLQARLASPETFARIGLEPPRGVVADLAFAVALDARGQPVIRVTSAAPVQQATLTFLVEVDWGSGRLVREYSALLDAPRTVSAPVQPVIAAPMTAPSNAIVRPPEPPPAAPAVVQQRAPASPPSAPAPPPVATPPAQTQANPVPAAQPSAESRAAASDAIPAPPPRRTPPKAVVPEPAPAAPPEPGSPGADITVGAGQTASSIIDSRNIEGYTREQAMLALLRTNPDAFIRGNVNLIKRGAVLRMPAGDELSKYGAAEARAMLRTQVDAWRAMRKPTPQPDAVAGDAASAPANAAAAPATATARAPVRAPDARLEITPPAANAGKRAGTQSGLDAGGEGDMLRQQEMQQATETLAARDAEVRELKARVADLEKLQTDQQKLIAMKDSELAAAQRNLAAKQAAPAATAATPAAPAPSTTSVWPWAALALVVALLAVWWFSRRKAAAAPARPTTSIAPSFAKTAAATLPADPPAKVSASPGVPVAAGSPAWHAPGPDASGPAATPARPVVAPAPAVAEKTPPASATPVAQTSERIELARAYLDLGDADTARGLLREVAESDDAAARNEARRLLHDLG